MGWGYNFCYHMHIGLVLCFCVGLLKARLLRYGALIIVVHE